MCEYSHEAPGSGGRSRWMISAFFAIAEFFMITERRAPPINLERKPAQARRIMGPSPAYLELQIEGVAGVPRRSFRWESKAFE